MFANTKGNTVHSRYSNVLIFESLVTRTGWLVPCTYCNQTADICANSYSYEYDEETGI